MSSDGSPLDWMEPEKAIHSKPLTDHRGLPNSMLRNYVLDGTYDEMFTESDTTRPQYSRLLDMFMRMPAAEIERCKRAADLSFLTLPETGYLIGFAALRSVLPEAVMDCPRDRAGGG